MAGALALIEEVAGGRGGIIPLLHISGPVRRAGVRKGLNIRGAKVIYVVGAGNAPDLQDKDDEQEKAR